MKKTDNIYLVGFMGVGKSTISKQLQPLLGWKEVDTDKYIVGKKRMSISDIFEAYGEAYFRTLETNILKYLAKEEGQIISCGGGMALKEENRKIMKASGTVFLLSASPQTIYEHVKNGKERPLLNGHMDVKYIAELMEKRRPCYEKAGDIEIVTDSLTPEEVAEKIAEHMKEQRGEL